MSVYFIYQLGRSPKVLKIGRSGDRLARLRQLQTGNPDELKIVGWIDQQLTAAGEFDNPSIFLPARASVKFSPHSP